MDEKQNQSENLDNPIQTETQNIKSQKPLITLSTFTRGKKSFIAINSS